MLSNFANSKTALKVSNLARLGLVSAIALLASCGGGDIYSSTSDCKQQLSRSEVAKLEMPTNSMLSALLPVLPHPWAERMRFALPDHQFAMVVGSKGGRDESLSTLQKALFRQGWHPCKGMFPGVLGQKLLVGYPIVARIVDVEEMVLSDVPPYHDVIQVEFSLSDFASTR